MGVLGLNAVVLAVGYALLAVPLRGLRPVQRLSYAGVALLVGFAILGVLLGLLAVAGARADLTSFALATGFLTAAGLVAGRTAPERWARRLWAAPGRARAPASAAADAVSTVACFAVVAIGLVALVGAFRSSPWLSDVWSFWLPKGIALDRLGLDPRLFAPSGTYVGFANGGYPLWWSIVTNLDVRFVGEIDLRAVNAQLTILAISFFAAVARLLWGRVRPVVLWPALLLLAACPELLRHLQGGLADLPLAIYLSLFVLAAAGWLVLRQGFALVLASVFAAAALAIKLEGWPELIAYSAVLSVFGWQAGRRALLWLWAAVAAAALTAVPWLVWTWEHRVQSSLGSSRPLPWSERIERVRPAAEAVLSHVTNPREWLVVVALCVVLSLVQAFRGRSRAWLGPPALLAAGFAVLVLIFVLAPEAGSVYRIVDPLVLVAAVLLPILGEALLLRPAAGSLGTRPGWPPAA